MIFLAPVLALGAACRSGESTTVSATGAGGTIGAGGAPTSTSTSTTGSGGAPAVPFRIIDWNTHDFFDAKNDGPNDTVLSAADYASKRQAIGSTLKALDGDIIVLAEVEKKAILDDLNKSELASAYAQTILIDGNDPRGIDIGILTKIAADSVVSHKEDVFTKVGTNGPSYQYSRDCLEAHFTVNGRKLILLGVHFKAKAAPDDPDKRLAEAQHTRAIADGLQAIEPEAAILVLGDFNDTPASAPIDAVVGAAPSPLFADSADAVATAARYSYVFQSKLELIDHQMASPILAAMLDPTQVMLKHGEGIDDGSKYASDHSPLKATYLVR